MPRIKVIKNTPKRIVGFKKLLIDRNSLKILMKVVGYRCWWPGWRLCRVGRAGPVDFKGKVLAAFWVNL